MVAGVSVDTLRKFQGYMAVHGKTPTYKLTKQFQNPMFSYAPPGYLPALEHQTPESILTITNELLAELEAAE